MNIQNEDHSDNEEKKNLKIEQDRIEEEFIQRKQKIVSDLMYKLPYTSLPFMNEITLFTHYQKHHYGYAMKLINTLCEIHDIKNIENLKILEDITIDKILEVYDEYSSTQNNAAQVYNHNLFWKSISDTVQESEKATITKNRILSQVPESSMIQKGCKHFGSGYLWLLMRQADRKIIILTESDAYIPLKDEYHHLACIDLWEHAYYLDYLYDRKSYLKTIIQYINWEFIGYNLAMADQISFI